MILAVCFQFKQLKQQPERKFKFERDAFSAAESTLRGLQFHSCLSAVYKYDFHIFIFIYIHYHRVYEELTIDHLSMWLDSSVDRALHRYRRVVGPGVQA